MDEVRRKVLALLSADLGRDVLVDLLIDVVARGLGRLGGRPRNGSVGPMTHVEVDGLETGSETSNSHHLILGSGSGSSLIPDPDLSKPDQVKRELDEPRGFLEFWGLYPKRVGKNAARLAWRRKKPPITKVRAALAWQINTDQWHQGYIPNPSTWINQGRWEDEPPVRLGPVMRESDRRTQDAGEAFEARLLGRKP